MSAVERFQMMPTYEELLRIVCTSDATPARSLRRKLFFGIYLLAWFVMMVIMALIIFKVEISIDTAYIGLGAVVVASIFWITDFLLNVSKHRDIFLNPARALTRDLDAEHSRERTLAKKLANFGSPLLTGRLNRIEAQLLVHERWIDITRLVGLLGPALLLATKYLGWEGGIQEGIQWVGGAFLSGSIIGAMLLRSGLRKMQRVVFVLRMANEMQTSSQVRPAFSRKRFR